MRLHNNMVMVWAPEGKEGGAATSTPAAPAAPERRSHDAHTTAVDEILNKSQERDDSHLNIADQRPTTERALRGADADADVEDLSPGRASELEIRELLTFDPFSDDEDEHPSAKRAKSTAKTRSDGTEGGEPDKSGEQAGTAQKEQEQPQVAPVVDELQRLRNDLAEAQRTIRELVQRQVAPAAAAPKVGAAEEEEAERQRLNGMYAWSVPDQIAEALTSENISERKQALGLLINAAARETHLNVHREVREVLEQLVGRLPQIVQGQIQSHSTQQDWTQDLYGSHPDLNKPAIRKLVPDITRQVAAEMGATAWTQALRDGIAQRVRLELGLQQPQAQPQPLVQPTPVRNVAKPPAAFRTTVRSAPSGYVNRQQEDIMRTLGLD